MIFTFDTEGEGLGKVLKEYQAEALRHLWSLKGEGASSRQVWEQVNRALKGTRTVSRASIINFLNDMAQQGVLNYEETTGKGGHRRIYAANLDESDFKKTVAQTVIDSLLRDFPQETTEAMLETYLRKEKKREG